MHFLRYYLNCCFNIEIDCVREEEANDVEEDYDYVLDAIIVVVGLDRTDADDDIDEDIVYYIKDLFIYLVVTNNTFLVYLLVNNLLFYN